MGSGLDNGLSGGFVEVGVFWGFLNVFGNGLWSVFGYLFELLFVDRIGMHIIKKIHILILIIPLWLNNPSLTLRITKIQKRTNRHKQLRQILLLRNHILMTNKISQQIFHILSLYLILTVPYNKIV